MRAGQCLDVFDLFDVLCILKTYLFQNELLDRENTKGEGEGSL